MDSDEDVHDVKSHKKLLEGIDRLNKIQRIRKPTRNEPAIKTSEFHLSKEKRCSGSDNNKAKLTKLKGKVGYLDLAQVLRKTTNHISIGKELNKIKRTNKTLKKPLEKPEAERIQRSIGYDNTKTSLGRWDAVVTKNRASEHLSFPLVHEQVKVINEKPRDAFSYRIKPDWMEELEKLTPKEEINNEKTDDNVKEFPLTLDELREKRKEMARLRVKESYRIEKARRMNKIKSKKYHKLMKRDKIRAQLKEFELLQKTDPDAAMKQLEMIEKTRILERASLRHKNTGTWAKNLQIRAKYDKDVRKELAQQLAISRDLTQKHKMDDSDEEERMEDELDDESGSNFDPMNPWVSKKKDNENEIDLFYSGYKKYWDDRNSNKKIMDTHLENDDIQNSTVEIKRIQNAKIEKNISSEIAEPNNSELNDDESDFSESESGEESFVNTSGIWEVDELEDQTKSSGSDLHYDEKPIDAHNKKRKNKSIDDIFDSAENRIEKDVIDKLFKIRNSLETNQKTSRKQLKAQKRNQKNESNGPYKSGLEFPTVARRPDLDDELLESTNSNPTKEDELNIDLNHTPNESVNNIEQIDPTKFIQAKPKYISTTIKDSVEMNDALDDVSGDENDDNEKQLTIAEAFEEDDIVADFMREKEDEKKKDETADINNVLPGWGSWTGTGVVASDVPKNNRFIIKMPKNIPRRDDNKSNVIINETANSKLKSHLVSQLPFPFKTVKDYEASIRAPVGAAFIPETASRALTKPAVETKMGIIIEPMDENMLLKKKVEGPIARKNNKIKNKKK